MIIKIISVTTGHRNTQFNKENEPNKTKSLTIEHK